MKLKNYLMNTCLECKEKCDNSKTYIFKFYCYTYMYLFL